MILFCCSSIVIPSSDVPSCDASAETSIPSDGIVNDSVRSPPAFGVVTVSFIVAIPADAEAV